MDVKALGIEIRHDLVYIAAPRQCGLDRWSSQAEALHWVGFLDQDEL